MNRLSKEKSPYLLQHAANPVNWFAWEPEAFAAAQAQDKPVFLSIGYSTCHWCHVMAHESFEDAEVAEALNRDYICIKVDREERPDVDAVYMAACQMFTGSGGWPLTVLMTPDQKPFWAGTYLPKRAAYGRMGLMDLLDAVHEMWQTERETLLSKGDEVTSLLKKHRKTQGNAQANQAQIKEAVKQFKRSFDPKWGGFGSAPKFPTPHNFLLLLQYHLLEKDEAALQMVRHTLTQMFRGGIFDHIGGGFSRYSTDEKWLVPHFEKMLYDNALLTLAYLKVYAITGDTLFKSVAQRTLDYVLRELRDPSGGFYCGQDADSEGVEGKYYTFTKQEIEQLLGREDAAAFCDWFGITERGNFEGKNILNLLNNPNYAQASPQIEALSQKLYAHRPRRTSLHKDDKLLTSWNALMIAALANAGRLLNSSNYLQAAKEAQQFIETLLTDESNNLKLRYREGEAAHAGQLDDYAFYAFALLELYQSTYEVAYLRGAIRIAEQMLFHFWDEEQGGLFLYSKESEQLIIRPKETYDGALPSGNSVAANVFASLFKLTGELKWQQKSEAQLRFLSHAIQDYPAGHSMALLAVAQVAYPSHELVCVTAENSIPAELTAYLQQNTMPNLTVLVKTPINENELEQAAPFTKDYPIPKSSTLYYLCQNGTCAAPTTTLPAALQQSQAKE